MGPASLQVCMDDWLQGTAHEDGRMDSSSPSTGDMITCSRPMLEKRLRPPHDQALKCPRCDSAHTKFCYYNNYSLSQPRYFCKTCRRYWTKGGSLRNIPVGGGCRKNKRVSAKKSSSASASADQSPNQLHLNLPSHHNMTDLQLSFPDLHLSHLNTLLGNNVDLGHSSFIDTTYNSMLDQPMDSKYEAILASHRNHDFGLLGNNVHLGLGGDVNHASSQLFFHHLSSPYGMPFNANNGMETCHSLMHPFQPNDEDPNAIEMKPNKQLLSLEWQDQPCSEVGKDTFGYFTGMGSWNGAMNAYGSSTTNPLV